MFCRMLTIWSLVLCLVWIHLEHLEVFRSWTVEAWLGELWASVCYCVRWVQLCGSLSILWHCISLGLEWTDLSQSCGHCWLFQICWQIECSTFTESSFRIWNSSTGIPSPPLTLFVVMLPEAQLTSHYRMSGSRCMITPSWLSGLWRPFLYSSSMYSCHIWMSSASVRFMPLCPSLHEMFPWYL